jgi:threonine/homoserine/homoserine lactone efflux protein
MSDTLISLLPYILGSALAPSQIIIAILLLKSPQQGLLKALLFVAGMTATRLVLGVVFGLIFDLGDSTDAEDGGGMVVSTLLLVLGILLLVAAFKKWNKEADPDEPPPKWLAAADQATILQSFLFGAALPLLSPKQWVFLLSALSAIDYAQLGQPASTVAFLVFILLAQSLLLIPILVRILLPQRSAAYLEATSAWLELNNRSIVIAVSLVFGVFFFYQGASGLLQ